MKKKPLKTRPLISVGIIFKNEIRCIERCLRSIVPLKEFADVEIVMADTGSDDGSREVAERYADTFFDFPWISDFAAARNAVMDRSRGKWYFSIDCDEWLDGDLKLLVSFLENESFYDYIALPMRNYKSTDENLRNDYGDFTAIRILRMSTGLRFEGAVHERWPGPKDGGSQHIMVFPQCFLHHDGYAVDLWDGNKKSERNMELLLKKAKEEPDDLLIKAQLIESSGNTPEYLDYVRDAVQGVKDKLSGWKMFGPPILRDAVSAAATRSLPELDEWIQLAEDMYPDSIYTKIDIEYLAAGLAWNKGKYADFIRHANTYFEGIKEYRSNNFDLMESLTNAVAVAAPSYQHTIRIFQIGAYAREKQFDKAFETLKHIDGSILDAVQAENLSKTYQHLYWTTNIDFSDEVRRGWEEMSRPEPTQEAANLRRYRFLMNAAEVFQPVFIKREPFQKGFCRHAYGVYKALEGKSTLATASAIMECEDKSVLGEKLASVENLDELPSCALEHALLCGVRFPMEGRHLSLELMDRLASRLAKECDGFNVIVEQLGMGNLDNIQALLWARAVMLAAVKTRSWKETETDMEVARKFAKVEGRFVPYCYSPSVLTDEGIWVLPALHRLGWYCAQAFEALDRGAATDFIILLRKGLEACPEMRSMVDFLLEDTRKREREKRMENVSQELLSLADQVQSILNRYSPDDPAVLELKASPAYQQVAWLIEEPASAPGGLTQ